MMWIPLIGLFAFIVKSATGFGPAIVIVGFGTLAIGIEHAVPLAAMFDLVSGLVLLAQTRGPVRPAVWRRMGVTIAVTSLIGGVVFAGLDTSSLLRPLGVVVILSALAVLVARSLHVASPTGEMRRDVAYGSAALGGLLGGVFGISGPPVVIAASTSMRKQDFRSLVAPVFLASAVTRFAVYLALGSISIVAVQALLLTLLVLPIGAAIGDRVHHLIPENTFLGLVTVLLVLSGVSLLR
jgi:uncharacterized membrane protein YfcA